MSGRCCFVTALISAVCVWPAAMAGAPEQPATTAFDQNVFEKGRGLFYEGKYREAAAEFDAIALKNQGEGQPAKSYRLDALEEAARSYVRQDDWPEAKRRFEKIIAAGDTDEPIIGGFPSGFRRMIIAYEGLMEAATREKDYKRAKELAEAGDKKITERLASIEHMMQTQSAPKSELLLRPLLLKTKPLFDWRIAHPDQRDLYYYGALRKAKAPKANVAATSSESSGSVEVGVPFIDGSRSVWDLTSGTIAVLPTGNVDAWDRGVQVRKTESVPERIWLRMRDNVTSEMQKVLVGYGCSVIPPGECIKKVGSSARKENRPNDVADLAQNPVGALFIIPKSELQLPKQTEWQRNSSAYRERAIKAVGKYLRAPYILTACVTKDDREDRLLAFFEIYDTATAKVILHVVGTGSCAHPTEGSTPERDAVSSGLAVGLQKLGLRRPVAATKDDF